MLNTECASREDLSDLLLGKLPPEQTEALTEHLESCPACQAVCARTPIGDDTLIAAIHQAEQATAANTGPELERALQQIREFGAAIAPQAIPEIDLGAIRDYRLLSKLGEGGMGTVYKALHTRLDKLVALKVLPADRMHSEAVARFQREMKAVGKLHHANIVQAFDAGEHEGTHFLVMELIDGHDLSHVLSRGPLSIANACELVRQTAVALQYVHEHGMVHRDIKPSNLVLNTAGQVKVFDLGLALLHDPAHEGTELTGVSQTMGTADYVAPEQTGDSHNVDIRADIYSLGCTLYKLLAGDAPYVGPKHKTPLQKIIAHLGEPFPNVRTARPDVPLGLKAVLDRMVAKEPGQRFATPAEVTSALAPFCASHDLLGLATSSPTAASSVAHNVDPTSSTVGSELPLPAALEETNAVTPARSASEEPASTLTRRASEGPAVSLAGASDWFRNRSALIALAAGGLALIALAVLIIKINTRDGVLVLEVEGPAPVIMVDGEAAEVKFDEASKAYRVSVKPGDHKLLVTTPEGLEFGAPGEFSISPGQETKLTARLERKEASIAPIQMPPAAAAVVDPPEEGEFVPLFNGKNFDGWNLRNPATIKWTISDLAVRGANSGYHPSKGGAIFTKRSDYGDFHFRCEVLAGQRGESWVYFRHNTTTEHGARRGYGVPNPNAEKLASPDAGGIGSLYEDVFQVGNQPVAPAAIPGPKIQAGEWYKLEIIARGKQIRVRVNGTTTTEFQADDPPASTGSFGFGCPILSSLAVRNVEVMELGTSKATAPESADPNRRVAHWVLSVGGYFDHWDGPQIRKPEDIPTRPIRFAAVSLRGAKISDDELQQLQLIKELPTLDLSDAPISDAGVAHLESISSLEGLNLHGSKISADVVASLAKLPKLTNISIGSTQFKPEHFHRLKDLPKLVQVTFADSRFGDAEAQHLASLPPLQALILNHTSIGNESLRVVAKLETLVELQLERCAIDAAGLAHLADLPKLRKLNLSLTKVSDEGLAALAEFPALESVEARATGFTDRGLEHLARIKGLNRLIFHGNNITSAGIESLHQALPRCRIDWDGGMIEPTATPSDPDRRAAEYVLTLPREHAIAVQVNDVAWINDVKALPTEPFRLTAVAAEFASKLDDAGLAHFQGCKHIKVLRLWGTQATARGLANFKDCRELQELGLTGDPIDDAALELFKDRPQLTVLGVQSANVTDAGLVHFQHCQNLTSIALKHTKVTDAGLAYFKDQKKLKKLALGATQVTDAGLAHFANCDDLEVLELFWTKVSDAGLTHFKDCLRLKEVNLNRLSLVSDAGLANFQACAELRHLNLGGTSIGDDGLAALKHWKGLAYLQLDNTKITDAGLIHLNECKLLGDLNLGETKVTAEGLVHLHELPSLARLNLAGTALTNESVDALSKMWRLRWLALHRTRLTEAGLKKLAAALPQCKIEWDGAAKKPNQTNDSRGPTFLRGDWSIEEGVLTQTGKQTPALLIFGDPTWADGDFTCEVWHSEGPVAPNLVVRVQDERQHIYAELGGYGNTLSDLQLVQRSGFKRLNAKRATIAIEEWVPVQIKLRGKQIQVFVAGEEVLSGEDATRLTGSIGFRTWGGMAKYRNPRFVDPEGKVLWEGLPELPSIDLDRRAAEYVVRIGGSVEIVAGDKQTHATTLAMLPKDAFQVNSVYLLDNAKATDINVAYLASCKKLRSLNLAGSNSGDAELARLAAIGSLESINLKNTKVTADGLKNFASALPKCKIEWDGEAIEPQR